MRRRQNFLPAIGGGRRSRAPLRYRRRPRLRVRAASRRTEPREFAGDDVSGMGAPKRRSMGPAFWAGGREVSWESLSISPRAAGVGKSSVEKSGIDPCNLLSRMRQKVAKPPVYRAFMTAGFRTDDGNGGRMRRGGGGNLGPSLPEQRGWETGGWRLPTYPCTRVPQASRLRVRGASRPESGRAARRRPNSQARTPATPRLRPPALLTTACRLSGTTG